MYGIARLLDKNLLVLSGDTHNAWANDLQDQDGNQVGVEFATGSVSSPGLEEYLPGTSPAELAAGVRQLIPTLAYADTSKRGYLVLRVTPAEAQADWHLVSTVKETVYTTVLDKSLTTLPGAGNRKIVRA
ncbi:alkaline phosphatase D family protein [Thiothrix nivea]|uniref:alkaline phosphatase D family protein n=1 Tax=Thiothrix nivea TaxID=1031 RepID=UPI0002E33DC2|nr:alkaline phosphatase D family protein [Thiothrix nivea]